MIKYWLKKRYLRVMIDSWIGDIETQTLSSEEIQRHARWAVENRVREEVVKFVEIEMDREICRKVATDLLKDFDYKPVLEKAMIEKFEGYVRGSVAPPMDVVSQYRRLT